MQTPQTESATPGRERLSWKEICARYPNEWVTMIELEWADGDEDSGELASAVVLGHGTKRGESLHDTRAIRERENVMKWAHWFTGEPIAPVLPLS